jgi:predicted transcriptional regulator
MVKMTFTLDDETVGKLRDAAARLKKPQSQVVREAVQHYYERTDKLTPEEREEKLRILREIMAQPPTRPQQEVEKEVREIRLARRRWGRRRAHGTR